MHYLKHVRTGRQPGAYLEHEFRIGGGGRRPRRVSVGLRPALVAALVTTLLSALIPALPGRQPAYAAQVHDTVPVGDTPVSTAVNPITNKVYVANGDSDSVTVIDGATHTTTTLPVSDGPWAVAVNPFTNTIYVAQYLANQVTVIDGHTDQVTAVIDTGLAPLALAVNPVTNRLYVANEGSNTVMVIDGATNDVIATLSVAAKPWAVAVNPVTGRVYVTSKGSGGNGTVSVIDGATHQVTATVTAGEFPIAVAVNPVTNKIYVANASSNDVTVIDGTTHTTTTLQDPAAQGPKAVAVNPVTNKIYVPNEGSENMTVIDGTTDTIEATVSVGLAANAVVVNPATNTIYVVSPTTGDGEIAVFDGETHVKLTTLSAGAFTNSTTLAANPLTGRVYTTNYANQTVTVIDGTDFSASYINVGDNPAGVAVDPVAGKVYVANRDSDSVSVVDIATGAVETTVPVGDGPSAVAVNPFTRRVYVANEDSGEVTVLDGESTSVIAAVFAGDQPAAIAVNLNTDRVYVANRGSGDVTVIDGNTASVTATVYAGVEPVALAVNPSTDRIYVANHGSDQVAVINGQTDAVEATVAAGDGPNAVAVDPVTNRIYVANELSGDVTVIDGDTHDEIATLAAGPGAAAVAVDPGTNRVYVANRGGDSITAIDAATHEVIDEVASGSGPVAVAVDPVSHRVYVANSGASTVTVISDRDPAAIPLTTDIVPLPGHQTTDPTPSFTFMSSSGYTPMAPEVLGVYYQVDTRHGEWLEASGSGGCYQGTTPSLAPGLHVLYALAVDGQFATSINTGSGSSPIPGAMAAYVFQVLPGGGSVGSGGCGGSGGGGGGGSGGGGSGSSSGSGASPCTPAAVGICVKVNPSRSVEVTNPAGTLALEIPGGAFGSVAGAGGADVDISVSEVEPADLAARIRSTAVPPGVTVLGRAFSFAAQVTTSDGDVVSVTRFARPLILRIKLDEDDLAGVTDPEKVGLFRLNDDGTLTFIGGRVVDGELIVEMHGFSTYVLAEVNVEFPDLDDHWARADIELMAAKHVVRGLPDGRFDPEGPVTRAEFAAMLVRAMGLPAGAADGTAGGAAEGLDGGTDGLEDEPGFKDVHPDDWFHAEVLAAAAAGIVSGYDDGTFRPHAPVTREQVAVMTARALRSLGRAGASLSGAAARQILAGFTDADAVSGWAEADLALAVREGIVLGQADAGGTGTRIAPQDGATRAQAAVMIARFWRK